MPARERSLRVDERGLGGDQSYNQRQHREAMARNTSPKGSSPRADVQPSQWDDADWDQDQDEAAGYRARRLLSRSNSGFHRLGDRVGSFRRWIAGERWVKRLAVVIAVLLVIFAGCFGGLWWRLGAGPINLEMATPWLASAIEENIGHGNTVEIGGTQIERAGRIRIAVRIRDIVVRDRDRAIVASAPKAEVKLSGTALLMGRLRAESLNLVDAELAVRITPDGTVTVSAGDTAQAARHRRGLEKGRRPGADLSAANPGSAAAARHRCAAAARRRHPRPAAGQRAKRPARRPRLARQPEPDRTRRPEPQRDRSEERQPRRRRPAARQQMDVRKHQPQPAPAERRRGGAERRRRGQRVPGRFASWSDLPPTACDRSTSAPTRSRPPISCWRCG